MLGAGSSRRDAGKEPRADNERVRRKPEQPGPLASLHDRVNRRCLRAHRGQSAIRDGPGQHGDDHGVHRRRSGNKRRHHREPDEPADVDDDQHIHRTGRNHPRRQHDLPPHHRGHGRDTRDDGKRQRRQRRRDRMEHRRRTDTAEHGLRLGARRDVDHRNQRSQNLRRRRPQRNGHRVQRRVDAEPSLDGTT